MRKEIYYYQILAVFIAIFLSIILFTNPKFTGFVFSEFESENTLPQNNTIFNISEVNFSVNISTLIGLSLENVSLIINEQINQTNHSGFGGLYNWTLLNLENGDYNWSVLVWSNDSNSHQSPTLFFKINKTESEIILPQNKSIHYNVTWEGAQFDKSHFDISDSLEYNWSINHSQIFNINSTGFLINSIILPVGNYYILVSINNSEDEIDSLLYNLNITPSTPSLQIIGDNIIWVGDEAHIEGVGCPDTENQSNLVCNFYKNGVKLPSNQHTQTFLVEGIHQYIYNTSGNHNYTSFSTPIFYLYVDEQPLPVEETPPLEEIPEIFGNFSNLEEQINEPLVALGADNIPPFRLNPGYSKSIFWVIRNTGEVLLDNCYLNVTGDYFNWVLFLDDEGLVNPLSLNEGDSYEFIFNITVPEDAEEKEYSFNAVLSCNQKSVSRHFTLEVEEKKLELKILRSDRIKQDLFRITYSLEEIKGEPQEIELNFSLLNMNGTLISYIEENRTLKAKSHRDFRLNMPINESLDGELFLEVDFNSEISSGNIKETIFLGSPIGGFVILDELGAGSIFIILGTIIFVLVALFIFNKIKNSQKIKKDSDKNKKIKKDVFLKRVKKTNQEKENNLKEIKKDSSFEEKGEKIKNKKESILKKKYFSKFPIKFFD